MPWTIYCHTHIDSGRRYVGLTKQAMKRRWNQHVSTSKQSKGGRWHFPNAIRKYGKDAFSHEILEVCNTLEEANAAEEKWIGHFDTRNPKKGFNLVKGGSHTPHPNKNPWDRPEYREKSKIRWQDPEFRKKRCSISRAMWQDPEYQAKVSTAAKQTWEDPEYRSKVSSTLKKISAKPEPKAKRSAASKAMWQDPSFRERNAESYKQAYLNSKDQRAKAIKAALTKPESKAKRSAASKIMWQDPEFRVKNAERWNDPNFRAKCESGLIKGAQLNKNKTHCPHGHEYSIENTMYDNKGSRVCLICKRIRINKCMRKRRSKILLRRQIQ